MRCISFVILPACLLLHYAAGTGCESYKATQNGAPAVCAGVVDSYFPMAPKTEEAVNGEVAALLGASPALSLLPPPCLSALKKAVCATKFMACGSQGGMAVPRFPCQSLCQAVFDPSGPCPALSDPIMTLGVDQQLNCSARVFFPPGANATVPLYPVGDGCSALANTPAPVQPRSEPYQGSVCQGFASTTFVPPGTVPLMAPGVIQATMEAAATARVQALPRWLPSPVATQYRRLICGSVFMLPQTNTLLPGFQITLPRLPSQALCQETNQVASAFIAFSAKRGKDAAVNCSAVITEVAAFAGLPQYPAGALQRVIPASSVPAALATVSAKAWSTPPNNATHTSGTVATSCPLPLVVPPTSTAKRLSVTGCSMPCPVPIFTPSEREGHYKAQRGVSIAGTIVATFMAFSWRLLPRFRRVPAVGYFWITSSSLSAVFALGSIIGLDRTYCVNDAEGATQSDLGNYCVYQGIMIHYFAMAAVIWWSCMALEVYLRLCTTMPAPRVERLRPWFHVAGWGTPVLFVVPALIGRQYGYRAPIEWCFIRGVNLSTGENEPVWQFGLFYGPVVFLVVTSVVLVGSSVVQLVQSLRRVKGSVSHSLRRQVEMFKTPVLFMIMFTIVFTLLVYYRIVLEVDSDSTQRSVEQWVQCLLQQYADGVDDPAAGVCGAHPAERPRSSLMYLAIAVTAGQGLCAWVAFGTSKKLYSEWAVLLCKHRPSFRSSSPVSSSRAKGDSGIEMGASTAAGGVTSDWNSDSAWSLREGSSSVVHVNPLMGKTGASSQVGAVSKTKAASEKERDPSSRDRLSRTALGRSTSDKSAGAPPSANPPDDPVSVQGIRRDSVLDWVKDSDDEEDEEDGAIPNLLEDEDHD